MGAVSSSGQSSLKKLCCSPIGHFRGTLCLYFTTSPCGNLSYEKELDLYENEPISRTHFHKTQFDTGAKHNLEMAHSPYHLEGMVNDDDIDLLVHSFDIHGIPRPDESQHFDGHPRAA